MARGVIRVKDPETGEFVPLKSIRGEQGVGIATIERTEGDGSAGSTDVYTIKLTDGQEYQFSVYNGKDGQKGDDGDGAITKEAVEAVLTGDITSHEHSQYLTDHQDISGKLDISGGTMTGKLVAQYNTSYTTFQARNIALLAEGASAPTGGNGGIYFVYSS